MTVFTNYLFNTTTGTIPRTEPDRWSDLCNIKEFGTNIGNGVTDATPAFTAAFSAIASTGRPGILYVPPGTYNFISGTMAPPSNCIVQGAGIDATTILSTCVTGGLDTALTVQMTMTGGPTASFWASTNTTYAINTPTLGATTVTTTTAANAGNFNPGDVIMISGTLSGGAATGSPSAFWFPAWFTTVLSANATTGVITLIETLPLGGNQLNLVQKIVSLPKNITVRDMTLTVNSNIGGVSGGIVEILGGDSILLENLKLTNANPTLPGAAIALGAPVRRSGFSNCHAFQGAGPIELFGGSDSFIERCTTTQTSILVDGGSLDCTVINNNIKDPQENAASFYGISIAAYTSRIRVIGNSVTGIPSGWAGIAAVDNPDANRYHTIVGNNLSGANTTNTVGVQMSKGVVVGNLFTNLGQGILLESISDTIVEGNYFTSTTIPLSTFSGTGVYQTRENPTIQTMAAGTASPTVQGGNAYNLFNSSAQNVTSFTGGLGGDEITIVMQDAHTTFVHSGNLVMKGLVPYNPVANTVMCFLCLFAGTWAEKSRSQ